ncbi:MAG: nucleoside triphosphate pyrophosphohydrolase family protein [Candidatus Caenarcaniphilales bacterium]|nr:nucleoside triphosphate pyrophosphohydrolase family protein [Candidatus Caenarcaniphilales bacterium]
MNKKMITKDYIQNAIRTESKDFAKIQERFTEENIRLLHATMGLATEAGEALDALKKHLYYGKPLDKTNLKEEMGDLFWYLAIMADTLDIDFAPIMERNIEKLKARYGEKFSDEKAIKRDLSKEREILEANA